MSPRGRPLLGAREWIFIAALLCSNAYTLWTIFRPDSVVRPSPAAPAAAVASFKISNITQRTLLRGHGMQGFVFFSSYRIAADQFVVLGLSPLILHHALEAKHCKWLAPLAAKDGQARGDPIPGRVTVEYPGEAHQKPYETILLFCELERGTAAGEGGHLRMVIDGAEVVVYGEPMNSKIPFEPLVPFKSSITYCSQPIYGDFNEQRVMEWVEYHRIGHGVDRFHLYAVGPVSDPVVLVLKPYMETGVMTLTDISEVRQFENWYAQTLAMNDCIYRSRMESKWVLFLDLDEYLYVDPPKGNLLSILSQHEGQAWVSFGSEFFFTKMCSHSLNVSLPLEAAIVERVATTRWEVERMIFKQSDVHCVAPKKYPSRFYCLGYDGHRKYVADPRQIVIAGIHSVTKPTVGGVDLDARDVHLNHYRGLNTNYIKSCNQYIHDTDWIPKSWRRDFSLSHTALEIRLNALRASLRLEKGYKSAYINTTLARIGRELGGFVEAQSVGDSSSLESDEDVAG